MFIDRHEESDDYVLTYVNGDDYEDPLLAAITDRETPGQFVSDELPANEREYPLNKLANSRYLTWEHADTDFDTYVSRIRRNRSVMPQDILEELGEDVSRELTPADLEEDSHDPVDVEEKLDMLDRGDVKTPPGNQSL